MSNQFFTITILGTELQAPIEKFVPFKNRGILDDDEDTAYEDNRGFQILMEYSETEPPVPYMETFWPYEYGDFDSSVEQYNQAALEKFLLPHNGCKTRSVSNEIQGLYQDNKPVTVTITIEQYGATPTITTTPA